VTLVMTVAAASLIGAKAGGYVDVLMEAVRWAKATALYERYSQDA
jgi:hypothetical protein